MKIRPVEAELFHWDTHTNIRTDRQTDKQTDRQNNMMKLIVAFHNIAKSVEKHVHSRICHIGCKFSAVENFIHHCKQLPKERTLKLY